MRLQQFSTVNAIGNLSGQDYEIYKIVNTMQIVNTMYSMLMEDERFNVHVFSQHRLDPTNKIS